MSRALQHESAWEANFHAFLYRQLFNTVPPVPSSLQLSGKTGIVTGSNVGLGFECAKILLAHNVSRLILAVRSQAKGDAAADQLRKQFPAAKIEVWIVDMASYDSIRSFVKRCETLEKLDFAILNAGLMVPRFIREESTKRELTLQVNYISTVMLGVLLLPLLQSKGPGQDPGHLTLISSDTCYMAKLGPRAAGSGALFDTFDITGGKYDAYDNYSSTKIMQVMFIDRLSDIISDDKVIVNTANPGLCSGTAFGSDDNAWAFWIFARLLGRSAAVGAHAYVDAACVKGKESHGSYVSEGAMRS
jgi:NAD(P)-dependent dehydrogenase (short-subunit alcohol dehydrogenase family)